MHYSQKLRDVFFALINDNSAANYCTGLFMCSNQRALNFLRDPHSGISKKKFLKLVELFPKNAKI